MKFLIVPFPGSDIDVTFTTGVFSFLNRFDLCFMSVVCIISYLFQPSDIVMLPFIPLALRDIDLLNHVYTQHHKLSMITQHYDFYHRALLVHPELIQGKLFIC